MTLSISFADLLASAVTEPGIISTAYRQFHTYSLGNQLLAFAQCVERGIAPGPLATFPRWNDLGRHVRKGEKAITLCQPLTVKRPLAADASSGDNTGGAAEPGVFTRFVYKPHWFVLAQTEGEPLPVPETPAWSRARALQVLAVTEVPFDAVNGNALGFARGRTIAISPLNPLPHKTGFHELAHVLLGHTGESGDLHDDADTPRNLQEVEAEAVALLCCAALDLPGTEHSRGYIQAWWGAGHPIPERSAQRILTVADHILKAGTTSTEAQS